jgi:hypothetical protein
MFPFNNGREEKERLKQVIEGGKSDELRREDEK